MVTITEQTEKYLSEHPSIKDCLKKGVINYSKLARKVGKELDIEKSSNMEAILIACRRYALKLKKEELLEDKILLILKNSELEIKNKIVTLIISKEAYLTSFKKVEKIMSEGAYYALEGTKVFTIITVEKNLNALKKLFIHHIIKISTGLVLIMVKSPRELESTPGVMAYLYSLFSENGVNIVETMSCWTDTILVIEQKNLNMAMELFTFS